MTGITSFGSEPFRWGVLLALPPAFLGLPAASYAGIAAVNFCWHLAFGRDSPAAVYFIGGLFYGLTFGVLLQCLLFGILGQLAWQLGLGHLEPTFRRGSRFVKTAVWIGAELIVIPVSFYLTFIAYSGPALLSWLFPVNG